MHSRRSNASGRVTDPAYADLQHQFEVLGGYTLDQRVDAALSGLGFARDEWAQPPSAVSGGADARRAGRGSSSRILGTCCCPRRADEIIFDLDALEWLEEHLRRANRLRPWSPPTTARSWTRRWTRIGSCATRRVTAFRGDYRAYHRQREERDARATKEAGTQADFIAREQELVQRYRSQRKFSKMHEHEARLERLQAERREAPRASRRLTLPQAALAGAIPTRSGEIVVRIEDLVVGYLPGRGALTSDGQPATEPRAVATIPFLAAQRGERIGIVGPNGAGKTTLLRTIAGDLPPLDGTLTFGHAVQLGYLAQLRDAAIPGTTVLDAVLGVIPVTPGEARSYLARFLFRGDDALKEVRALSGGERSASSSRSWASRRRTCCCSTSRPTTSTSRPARRSRRSCASRPPRSSSCPMTGACSRPVRPTVGVDGAAAVAFDGGYRAPASRRGRWLDRGAGHRHRRPCRARRGAGAAPYGPGGPGGRSARTHAGPLSCRS